METVTKTRIGVSIHFGGGVAVNQYQRNDRTWFPVIVMGDADIYFDDTPQLKAFIKKLTEEAEKL